ncbi:uncharacterized protein [Solanum tuberosum]|uniref:uncharacterized protein n=1 Tax=Solanum tuberosum TaxID=4113 RepID=UPI00073A24F1|nr:PREDICTED: uncharacterized protein LOC107063448 [Solanum tuberosum]
MEDDDRKLVVVTRSGKVEIGNVMGNEDTQQHEEDKGIEEQQSLIHQNFAKEPHKEVEQQVHIPKVMQPLPKIHPPFPQRLKKNEDERVKKFLSVLKTLSINLPLVEALLEMLGYAKFMKDLVTKKRSLDFETIEVSYSCSAIMSKELIKKREYPGAFTILCTIGVLQFAKALCNLGASINLMPYEIYKQLGLGEPKETTIRLLMADRSIKHPVGILYDILVKVDRFIFSADFVILDCEIDAEIPIILVRPFLATGRALVDVKSGELRFWVNEDAVTFNICKSMKHPSDINVVSTDDVIDKAVASVRHLICMNEPLEAVLANYDESEVQGYEEVVAALSGLGGYTKTPIKLDIDPKNRESPLAKPSTEEPPNLELKALPSHLRYVFLGENNTLPVIIAADLLEWQIQLDSECKPSVEHQRRLNPPMQEVVKKEIIKWLDAFVIYPIANSKWVSSVQCVPKKGGITVVPNAKGELVPTRPVIGWREGIVLGHKMSQKGLEVDKEKIEVIEKLPPPISVKGIHSFLGHAGFYRSLREKLVSTPVIISPDWFESFEVICDASGLALGQKRNKLFHPIYYASKTLNSAQRNYIVTEPELLMVVYAYEKFRAYLLGTTAIVHTDHAALHYLMAKKDAKPRFIRWVLLLQEFDFEVKDRRGCKNQVFAVSLKQNPWYADFANYIVCGILPDEMNFYQQKRFMFDELPDEMNFYPLHHLRLLSLRVFQKHK